MKTLYPQRKVLRFLEKSWSVLENGLNRALSPAYNPLYYTGALSTLLFLLSILSGIYLLIFYRPGSERAYYTVEALSRNGLGLFFRTFHRYTANAFLIVAGVHALKSFLSDRFWGARWLAWLSGWGLWVGAWIVGVMGYWLVWDEAAQWLSEYLMDFSSGSFSLTFVHPDLAAKTFPLFVIVLFLHLFLPLVGFGLFLVHIMRLSRPRWIPPRWLTLLTVLALTFLSLQWPVSLNLPANLSRIPRQIDLDLLYLGFLPLSEAWGKLWFWGGSALIFGALLLLPWILSGGHRGPAQVIPAGCSGCTLCATECPYSAITMKPRQDDSGFVSIAQVSSSLCTGCGLCVGACATNGIALPLLSYEELFSSLQAYLETFRRQNTSAVLLFSCQRHISLGTVAAVDPFQPLQLIDLNGEKAILVNLPCVGMVEMNRLKALLPSLNGTPLSAILFLACPSEECMFREGVLWTRRRLERHPSLVAPGSACFLLEVPPGDRALLREKLRESAFPSPALLHSQVTSSPDPSPNLLSLFSARLQRYTPLFMALLFLLSFFGAVAVAAGSVTVERKAPVALLRIGLDTRGQVERVDVPPGVVLPPGADVERIFGGTHYPLSLRVVMDGKVVLEHTYSPSGWRGEGRISRLITLPLEARTYSLEIWLRDRPSDFRRIFASAITLKEGESLTLWYEESKDRFILKP